MVYNKKMPTLTTHVSMDELYSGVTQLEQSELDRFISRVLALQVERRSDVLADEEASLIQKINLGISADTWQRYDELKIKRQDAALTKAEHDELIDIGDRIEKANAQRMSALVELTGIRKTSLEALMDEFGIHSPGIE